MENIKVIKVENLRIVEIPRSHVDQGLTEPALQLLSSYSQDLEETLRRIGSIGICFTGYVSDKRELWEIPEVRTFVAKLHSKWPYWFVFLETFSDSLKLIAGCVVEPHNEAPNNMEYYMRDLHIFIESCQVGTKTLFEQQGLPRHVANRVNLTALTTLLSPSME